MDMSKRTLEESSPTAKTIAEFCWRQNISVPLYYQLKKRGLGPVEMRLGNTIRITPEAEAAWRTARENPTGAEADRQSQRDAALKARGQHAAKISVTSPNHISNRRVAARERIA